MTLWDRALLSFAPRLGHRAVGLLARTLKLQIVDAHHVSPFWERRAPVVYAVWHGRVLMLPAIFGKTHAVSVMASRSRDGELVARVVRRFGFEAVRGSTTRGGSEALRKLARLVRAGREVAVVPDGPLGPRDVVQPGIIALARLTGAPIVPMAFSVHPAWRLSSWDGFLIPRPFARAVVCFGAPLSVAANADRAGQEAARKELEAALAQLTWRADELARGE